MAFLPGFTGTDLSCPPHYAEKKNRSVMDCLYLIVTLPPKSPYNTIKGYDGSLVTSRCIPYHRTRYHAIFFVTYSVLDESTECINIFPYAIYSI